MALDLFALRPSQPAKLAASLRSGDRVDEFRSALQKFLIRPFKVNGADADFVYSTAAQLSSAGVFDAIDIDDFVDVFHNASGATRKIFLQGMPPSVRASLQSKLRERIEHTFDTGVFSKPVPTSLTKSETEVVRRVWGSKTNYAPKGFWVSLRAGKRHYSTVVTNALAHNNIPAGQFLDRYKNVTIHVPKNANTCVYVQKEGDSFNFSVFDPKVQENLVARMRKIYFDGEFTKDAIVGLSNDLASEIPGDNATTARDGVERSLIRLLAASHSSGRIAS